MLKLQMKLLFEFCRRSSIENLLCDEHLARGAQMNPNSSTSVVEPSNRVVQLRRFGGPEELEVVDAPLPKAGRGEVRVRVLASSLEYTDVPIRRHLYAQTMGQRPPFVLGYDVVGQIDQLGDGV